MLPYDKDYLKKEMVKVDQAIKYAKIKKKDTFIMFQYLLCLGIIFFSIASANEYWVNCPNCEHVIEMEVKSGTWSCSKCDYKNDNRIRYCGVCGAERQ